MDHCRSTRLAVFARRIWEVILPCLGGCGNGKALCCKWECEDSRCPFGDCCLPLLDGNRNVSVGLIAEFEPWGATARHSKAGRQRCHQDQSCFHCSLVQRQRCGCEARRGPKLSTTALLVWFLRFKSLDERLEITFGLQVPANHGPCVASAIVRNDHAEGLTFGEVEIHCITMFPSAGHVG